LLIYIFAEREGFFKIRFEFFILEKPKIKNLKISSVKNGENETVRNVVGKCPRRDLLIFGFVVQELRVVDISLRIRA